MFIEWTAIVIGYLLLKEQFSSERSLKQRFTQESLDAKKKEVEHNISIFQQYEMEVPDELQRISTASIDTINDVYIENASDHQSSIAELSVPIYGLLVVSSFLLGTIPFISNILISLAGLRAATFNSIKKGNKFQKISGHIIRLLGLVYIVIYIYIFVLKVNL